MAEKNNPNKNFRDGFIANFRDLPEEKTRTMGAEFKKKERQDPASSPRIPQFANDPDNKQFWLGGEYRPDDVSDLDVQVEEDKQRG